MKKIINLLMLSTILMSQLTFGLTAFAVEGEMNELSEISVEDDTSSTAKENEENSDPEIEIKDQPLEKPKETALVENTIETDDSEATDFIGPLTKEADTRASQMTVDSPSLWLPLGSPSEITKAIVKENATVKVDGKKLNPNEYDVMNVLDSDNTKTITSRDTAGTMIATFRSNDGVNGSKLIDYGVDYGDSIVFGTNEASSVAGAFTLHITGSQTSPKGLITARNGAGNTGALVNSDYSGQEYYKFEVFEKKVGMNSVIINEDSVPTAVASAKGNDIKSSVLSSWGDKTFYTGSVVRTWSAKSSANNLYKGRQSSSPTVKNYADEDGFAYYEITKNGYLPITATFLDVVERDISMSTTNKELDDSIAKSFANVPGTVTIEGFTKYPSREKAGKSMGEIKVSEILPSNGQRLERIYEVPFNVIEGEVEPEPEDEELELYLHDSVEIPAGTKLELINMKDYVEAIYEGSNEMDIDDYEIKFVDNPDTDIIGEVETTIEITDKDNSNNKATAKNTTNILWKNSIVTKSNKNNSQLEAAISLLDDEGKPYLNAIEGTGLSNGNNNLNSRPNISIYRESIDNELYVATSEDAEDTWDLMNNWKNEFDDYDLEYGDVMVYTVPDEKGKNTWVTRDEKLKLETEGYDEAYYEIDKDGFDLLQLNQVEVSKEIPKFDVNTSHAEMNKHAKEQMIIPDSIHNPDYLSFEYESVDTKTPGKKKTKMNVSELLQNGSYFTITYDVEYEVVEEIVPETLEVVLQEISIPVGTKTELLNPNDYVKEVRLGDRKLSSSEYTASFANSINTNLVSAKFVNNNVVKQDTKIKIDVKNSGETITETAATNVIWGDTVTTKTDSNQLTVTSVSLLQNNGKPYLAANEGVGFSGSSLTVDPTVSLYRGSMNNNLIKDGTSTGIGTTSRLTMNKWNEGFASLDIQYNVNIPRQQVHVNNLPKTGEKQQHWLFSLIGLSVLFVLFLALATQRKKQYERNR